MVLPRFNKAGDLPPGVYQATLDEVVERFGAARGRRNICTRRLLHVYALVERTGHLQRFIIFGSYVTATPDPNDVDVVLVMDDAFRLVTAQPVILSEAKNLVCAKNETLRYAQGDTKSVQICQG